MSARPDAGCTRPAPGSVRAAGKPPRTRRALRWLDHLAVSSLVFLVPAWVAHRTVFDPALLFAVASALVLLGSQPRLDLNEATSKDAQDRGSALAILAAVAACLGVASVDHALRFPSVGVLAISGVGLACFGLVLRLWAIRVLGRAFTSVVVIVPAQRVIRSGPYRWLRHPSYTGALMAVAGIAMVLASPVGLCFVLILCLPAYAYRIEVEEAVLVGAFGQEYADYRKRTWGLFPLFR